MQFRVDIKPRVIEGKEKPPITSFYSSLGVHYSKYGYGVGTDYTGDFVACNYEKHRKKVQRFGKNGQKLKKPIVTPAKWVCYYYKIPVSLLKLMNKRVVQHSRHWTLEDLK